MTVERALSPTGVCQIGNPPLTPYHSAMTTTNDERQGPDDTQRRSFFGQLAAVVCGGLVTLFPFAAGLGVVLDPLRRKGQAAGTAGAELAGFTRICPLDALADDGKPREFVVKSDLVDAWSRSPAQRVGAVFLTRSDAGGQTQVTALSASCPHLGCAVNFVSADDQYACPCHESGFSKSGEKLFGPSLRGLDSLEVKVVESAGTQEIWVAFKRYRAGVAERIAVG